MSEPERNEGRAEATNPPDANRDALRRGLTNALRDSGMVPQNFNVVVMRVRKVELDVIEGDADRKPAAFEIVVMLDDLETDGDPTAEQYNVRDFEVHGDKRTPTLVN